VTSTAEYQNKLEQTFGKLPGPVQSALRPAYQPVDDAIQWVCGDPDTLLAAGQKYIAIGKDVEQTATRIQQEVQALEAHWSDDVGHAFQNKVKNTSQALTGAATALSDTEKILTAGAKAAVDAANTICDIVVSVVEFIIADFVVSAALSVLTFGASVAAGIVAAIADWAEATFEVSRVVESIVEILRSIEEVLKVLEEVFKVLKEIFLALKELKKEVGFMGKLAITVAKVPISKLTQVTFNALPGVPNLPQGGVHWGVDAGKDADSTVHDVQDADAVDGG
jgi:uncharacterized protein YukE